MALWLFCPLVSEAQRAAFHPGKKWKDSQGNDINAHGGGLLFFNGTYYWYGEIKSGKTIRVRNVTSWEDYRVPAGGVSCYSSIDLLHWKYRGIVLLPNKTDSLHPLHTSRIIERPKVLYNRQTGKFVMWVHLDNEDYSYAGYGVAVSDSAAGPYHFLEAGRPNDNDARDMTVFMDDDGKAYHIYSSEGNATMHITLLTDDYLYHTGMDKRILTGLSREAPAIVKQDGKYYLFSSACTGWAPNAALYATADSIMGHWTPHGNPCTGKDAVTTFKAQSTFIQPIPGKPGSYIFMADRWNKINLPDSRYVWLPMTIRNGQPNIRWYDSWNLSVFNQPGSDH